MALTIANEIMSKYNYLIMIKCSITKDWELQHIPSFITNKPVNYLVKNLLDVIDIIKEIFLVWRYKYHTDSKLQIKESNIEYMEQIINKIKNMSYFPYLEFLINSGINSSINCSIKIFQMRKEFIHLLDLIYEPELSIFKNTSCFRYSFVSYVVYKDSNPNRLRIFIQNPNYINKVIDQTILSLNKIYDLDFYQSIFDNLELTLQNPEKFTKLLISNNSFLLSKDDFIPNDNILYSNIYILLPINTRVTTLQNELYFIKTNYIAKTLNEVFTIKMFDDGIKYKIMSFL